MQPISYGIQYMKKIKICAKVNNSYFVVVSNSIKTSLYSNITMSNYSRIGVITDENVKQHWKSLINREIKPNFTITLEPGEKHKNIKTLQFLWSALVKERCDKSTLLLIMGGGVIGDMAALAASTYLRGIDFIHIPTTIISQVDSSMGGKTAINFSGGKNIIGLFSQPKLVIINSQFLSTLPERDFISGFAEIIKHGLIADKDYYHFCTLKHPLEFTKKEIAEIITGSCRIKTEILNKDLLQKNERKLVLFGHTIGQALESVSLESSTPLLHGEAIAIGMVAETFLSVKKYNLPHKNLTELEKKLVNCGLPTRTKLSGKQVEKKLILDKKIINGKIPWTLLKKIGNGVFNVFLQKKQIQNAIQYICS